MIFEKVALKRIGVREMEESGSREKRREGGDVTNVLFVSISPITKRKIKQWKRKGRGRDSSLEASDLRRRTCTRWRV